MAEYSHVEAECPFIDFNDLLNRLEDLVCDVVDRVLKSPYGYVVKELNPDFVPPKRPFRRMDYSEAIQWLKDNNVTKDDGTFYEFGEVICCLVSILFKFSNFLIKLGYTRSTRTAND